MTGDTGKGAFHPSELAGLRLPRPARRLRLGLVGGGPGAFIGEVHAMGARLSNAWEVVAGAFSSDPGRARAAAADWYVAEDRAYADFAEMARREAARPDGIEAVAITTPNRLHHAVACAFLDQGIDVICDKPLATSPDDAADLVRRAAAAERVFAVSYGFACYPMVRQARRMVADGAIGRLRQVHVEYVQEWLAEAPADAEQHGGWRSDPAQLGGAVGDIGSHAFHLAEFVSGLRLERLRAETFVCGPPRQAEDTVCASMRYEGDVPGLLWATQVAPGNACGLRLRLYGERGGLEWDQEHPEVLRLAPLGEPVRVLTRGVGAGLMPEALRLVRTPRGHPEGRLEAWANFYGEVAVAIEARRQGRALPPGLVAFATVEDGARGVAFIEAVHRSHRAGGAWTGMPEAGDGHCGEGGRDAGR